MRTLQHLSITDSRKPPCPGGQVAPRGAAEALPWQCPGHDEARRSRPRRLPPRVRRPETDSAASRRQRQACRRREARRTTEGGPTTGRRSAAAAVVGRQEGAAAERPHLLRDEEQEAGEASAALARR